MMKKKLVFLAGYFSLLFVEGIHFVLFLSPGRNSFVDLRLVLINKRKSSMMGKAKIKANDKVVDFR